MKIGMVLLGNYLLGLAFFFACLDGTSSCDTKWIRFVYMMSCGKKKRESVWSKNESFFENLPQDFEGAFNYFKDKDPDNPVFSDGAFLRDIFEEDATNFELSSYFPKLILHENNEAVEEKSKVTAASKPSILIGKLYPKPQKNVILGIPGFPEKWDIEEIIDEKINENHRREIDRLIEECCKVPPVTTCNGNTFSGACK